MAAAAFAFAVIAILPSLAILAAGEIRLTSVASDARPIIPLDEFGFSRGGILDLNVSSISISGLSSASSDADLGQLGFFLSTLDSWVHVLRQLESLDITCALQSDLVTIAYTFDHLTPPSNPSGVAVARSSSFSTSVTVPDPGQYTLVFANCLPGSSVSMSVQSSMYNVAADGKRTYLSIGAAALPSIYFAFALVHAVLAVLWVSILVRSRVAVFRIHYFMLAVILFKTVNLLAEGEDKSFIARTGSAHGWDVLFYIFSFVKGISLFTLIVLIGTGWSFLKPYLQDREKKVLMVVIPLQVVANIAQVVIDESGPYAQDWVTWKQVFLLVDVVCCCAVLFPIVWSIKNLREAARSDGKAAVNLMKLTLFRQYYVVVICYIYFTRVVVYALATITSYRYLWTSAVAAELATLAFYVFTGYKFRPEVHNPYFIVDDEEEEAAAEALKMDDEFEL